MKLTPLLAVAAAGAGHWSAPATLAACPASGPPRVVFPSEQPSRATGPGAIVWAASPRCAGGEGARIAAIGAGDEPGAVSIPHTAAGRSLAPRGTLAVAAAPHGQVAIAGAAPGDPAHGQVIQGSATGPFSLLWSLPGAPAPLALSTAYLGDVALAAPAPVSAASHATGAGEPEVGVERHSSYAFAPRPSKEPVGSGPGATQAIGDLSIAMDFRSDALAVWAQGGVLYARDLPRSGARHSLQRLARVGQHLRLATLLSDDNRAIVAWAEERAGHTSVYIDRSAVGPRFAAPTLLERFADPDAIASPVGSPSLVRLSSESVMLAWAGSADGHWVVRTAGVDLGGVGSPDTIAAPGTDALLDALAPGPSNDALVLWSEPQPTRAGGPPELARQSIFSAHGIDADPDRARFGAPEQLAPPGLNSDATVALDPSGGGAVAVWRGEHADLEYAIREAPTGAP